MGGTATRVKMLVTTILLPSLPTQVPPLYHLLPARKPISQPTNNTHILLHHPLQTSPTISTKYADHQDTNPSRKPEQDKTTSIAYTTDTEEDKMHGSRNASQADERMTLDRSKQSNARVQDVLEQYETWLAEDSNVFRSLKTLLASKRAATTTATESSNVSIGTQNSVVDEGDDDNAGEGTAPIAATGHHESKAADELAAGDSDGMNGASELKDVDRKDGEGVERT